MMTEDEYIFFAKKAIKELSLKAGEGAMVEPHDVLNAIGLLSWSVTSMEDDWRTWLPREQQLISGTLSFGGIVEVDGMRKSTSVSFRKREGQPLSINLGAIKVVEGEDNLNIIV